MKSGECHTMSCICQYFGPMQEKMEEDNNEVLDEESNGKHSSSHFCSTFVESEISATELASARTENWLLRKKLQESEIAVENLESLITTILEKQHQVLSELHTFRKERDELLKECRLQREYHTIERNTMIHELRDTRLSLSLRTQELVLRALQQETLAKNEMLVQEVQSVNERIVAMGLHFLEYKSNHSNCNTNRSPALSPRSEKASRISYTSASSSGSTSESE